VIDAQSGFFRLLIYQFGWQSVLAHPWFGIGLNPYRRPDWMVSSSIDSHWLLLAVRYGLPAALLLFSASIVALVALARSQAYANRRNQYFYRGIMMSLATMVLTGFTVYIYGGTQTWLTILLGACVACSQHGYSWRVILPEEERAVAPAMHTPAGSAAIA
jgi:O-antigen ligase